MGAVTGHLCHSDFTKLSSSASQMLTAAASAAFLAWPSQYFLWLVHTTLSNLFSTLWKNTSASANPFGNMPERNPLKIATATLWFRNFH